MRQLILVSEEILPYYLECIQDFEEAQRGSCLTGQENLGSGKKDNRSGKEVDRSGNEDDSTGK